MEVNDAQEIIEYYDKIIKQQRPLKFFTKVDSKIVSLVDLIESYKTGLGLGLDLSEFRRKFPKFTPVDIAMVYYYTFKDPLNLDESYRKINSDIIRFYDSLGMNTKAFSLFTEFESWFNNYQKIRSKDVMKAVKILNSLNIINNVNISGLVVSPLKYNYVTRKTNPTFKVLTNQGYLPRNPGIEDGLDLFDYARPSYDVPYIQYNKNSSEFSDNQELDVGIKYKIYKGDSSNLIPLDLIVLSKVDTQKGNSIYMTIFVGTRHDNFNRESFIMASYDLESNTLIFSVPLRDENTANSIVKKIMTCLNIDIDPANIKDLTIGASFKIISNYVDHHIFSYAVLNKEPFSTFLFIDEKSKPSALKKVHRLRYKSIQQHFNNANILDHSAWITFSNVEALIPTLIPFLQADGTEENYQLEKGENYIEVNINKALDKNITETIYSEGITSFREELGRYMTLSEQDKVKQSEKTSKKKSTRGIYTLIERSHGYIERGYGRICQCKKQPIIIEKSEVPEWESKEFIHKGVAYPRKAMPFPPHDPVFYIICPNSDYPHPGVKLTKNPQSRLPYVPCCSKDIQTVVNSGTPYDHYYNGNPLKSTYKKKTILDTNKSLEAERFGKLASVAEKLLNKYNESDETKYYRYGVPVSSNSVLHCIFEAFDYPAYSSLPLASKDEFIRNYRRDIFSRFSDYPIEIIKQELYDFTDDEIKHVLVNPDVFLDPSLYYRYLEEIFNINIYVFTTTKNNEAEYAMLEVPRNKVFHTRRYREKSKTVLIFKSYGYEKANYPQCELIVSYDTTENVINEKMFDSDMSKLLHDVIMKTKNTLSWTIDPNNMSITARKNLYNSLDSYSIFKDRKLVGQIIDNYGKNRAFVFDESGQYITAIIPPCQPEKLSNLSYVNLPKPELALAYQVFGNEPTFISVNNKGLVDGLWFRVMDLDEGIYIPIQPVDKNVIPDVPIGLNNPLHLDQENLIQRYKHMQKVNKVILTCVQWLFIKSGLSLKDFIEQYFRIVSFSSPIDSNTFYDISKIRRLLPNVDDFSKCLTYLEKNLPGLVKDGRIALYSKKYAEGVIYYLKSLLGSVESPAAPREINYIRSDPDDFIQYNNTVIFTRENDMKIWYYTMTKMGLKTAQIHRKIYFSDSSIQEPFIYHDLSGKFYIIQNVTNTDFKRAINVSYNWYLNKVNYGYETEAYTDEVVPRYVLYVINSGNLLEAAKDNTGGESNFLQLLHYGESQYAAMLPL